MTEGSRISIWFFIGMLLTLYGIIITTASVYDVYHPFVGRETVLSNLNFGVWWGILLTAIGFVYFWVFRPWNRKNP